MKRDFNTVLSDLEGRTLKAGEPKYKRFSDGRIKYDEETSEPIMLVEPPDLTLKKACLDAISVAIDGDAQMEGDAKMKLYALATKIVGGGVVDVSPEEISTLKQRIAKAWPSVLVVGAAYSVLDADYAG